MKSTKKQKKNKPKYNIFQNIGFMMKVAWKAKEKKVIILCILSALLFVSNNLINLYFALTVLGVIEANGTMEQMLKTIIIFILALMLVGDYKRMLILIQCLDEWLLDLKSHR